MKKKDYIQLVPYIIGHFIVDFACAFLLYELIYGTKDWYLCLLVYNFCAFALQMPFGLLADRWNHNSLCASIGCGLIVLAFVLGNIETVAAVVLVTVAAGIGNALFHVGGGIDLLNVSRDKSFLLGIFVSPGALGLYFGRLLGKQNTFSSWFVILALLAVAVSVLAAGYSNKRSFLSDNVPISFQGIRSKGYLIAIGCLLVVVILRSYIGLVSNFSWKGQGAWGTILIYAVVFGKTSGGFLADRLGAMKASAISLGLASILYLFSNYPWFGIAAVFFFNMTMPITLWALARIMQGCKGFSFGVLTFGLFLGFAPVYLNLNPLITTSAGFSFAAVASFVLLWIGLRKAVV
jgi:FSR family fosmidomycin resistance protein-like MFS transporter